MESKLYQTLGQEFLKLISQNGLGGEEVVVKAKTLSTEQAIGNPEDKDYPLVRGVERLMQAEFRGARGQAFTDRYGNFSGRLADIAAMDLANNFRRAVFIASLNAVMRQLGMTEGTVHCKDEQPRECGHQLVKYLEQNNRQPKVAMVGFQPRIIEALAGRFEIKVTDMDQDNIGSDKFGVRIDSPDQTEANLDWCDLALVTGTTVVNNTIEQFRIAKPVVFYGVTIAGAAELLGLERFCPFGG